MGRHRGVLANPDPGQLIAAVPGYGYRLERRAPKGTKTEASQS